MRLIRSFGLAVVLTLGFNACFDAPQFAPTPEIEFQSIVFKKGAPPNGVTTPPDSLTLTLKFKDGDGDLGLDPVDIYPPYNDKYYWIFNDSSGIPTSNSTFLNYYMKLHDPDYDTLPDFGFLPNYTRAACTNWELDSVYSKGRLIPAFPGEPYMKELDTIYFKYNQHHYNIFVDFYVKQNDDSWQLYDWASEFKYPNCNVSGFNGRFPVLSTDLSSSAAQEGTIRYSMRSIAWLYFFGLKTLKCNIYIEDRALHRSNVVSTGPFTLQQ